MNAHPTNLTKTSGKMSYRATFSDGQVITRKSEREYNAAWKIVVNRRDGNGIAYVKTGFARTKQLAERARMSEAPRGPWDARRKCWTVLPEFIASFEVVATEYLG